MSLFAHRREYQRSIDRIIEDFSVDSGSQTETSLETVKNNRHRSVISPGNQRAHYWQHKIENAITPRVVGGYEFIHQDVEAWGRFLDSKRKK
jgi:hypothetical protein